MVCLLIQRHVESGQHHILNKTREVVALHKDRQMFPISLCVARLSGAGMDTLFIGVMRHSVATSSMDNQVVKVRLLNVPGGHCAVYKTWQVLWALALLTSAEFTTVESDEPPALAACSSG